jgi:hypothetical protein
LRVSAFETEEMFLGKTIQLTVCTLVPVEKLTLSKSRNSLDFMEMDSSLPYLQQPDTEPYYGPHASSSYPHFIFVSDQF